MWAIIELKVPLIPSCNSMLMVLFDLFPSWRKSIFFFGIPDILHILIILSPNRETVSFHIWTGMLMSSIMSIWYPYV